MLDEESSVGYWNVLRKRAVALRGTSAIFDSQRRDYIDYYSIIQEANCRCFGRM